jgi:hypothetical protein
MINESTTSRENRCVELNLSGYPCGLKAVAGHDRCYIHGIFRALNDGRCSIDIPLLEDAKAILFVYSQVARAMAQGAMPAANGNAIIRCCRGAQRLLEEQWKRERFEEKARQRAEHRAQSAGTAAAGTGASHRKSAQAFATVPCDFDESARDAQSSAAPAEPRSIAGSLNDASVPGEPPAGAVSLQAAADPDLRDPHPSSLQGGAAVSPQQLAAVREKFRTHETAPAGSNWMRRSAANRAMWRRPGSMLNGNRSPARG